MSVQPDGAINIVPASPYDRGGEEVISSGFLAGRAWVILELLAKDGIR